MMYLTGLQDDYTHDGRVISQILATPTVAAIASSRASSSACYKQLNSSVGEFGTATLIAETNAIESASPGDTTYLSTEAWLRKLEQQRDEVAGQSRICSTTPSSARIPRDGHHGDHDDHVTRRPGGDPQALLGACVSVLAPGVGGAAKRRAPNGTPRGRDVIAPLPRGRAAGAARRPPTGASDLSGMSRAWQRRPTRSGCPSEAGARAASSAARLSEAASCSEV